MSIFFPDNENRRNRLIQLAADSQNFLNQAKASYKEFLSLNTQVNSKLAEVFKKAKLAPPTVSPVDILKAQKPIYNVATADTVVEISNILLGVGGLVATVSYFAPAATTLLVETGVLEAETASAVLFSALGAEVTVGALAGGIIGGLVVGAVVVGIGLAIDAFEGYELRDELRKGIYHTDQIRASTKFALDKSQALVGFLQSAKTTCDALLAESIPLTEEIINNLIQKNAIPALRAIEAVTKASVLAELAAFDRSRGAWTNEDEAGKDIVLPNSPPIYVNAGIEVPENLCPSVPAGLKLTALQDPDHLDLKLNYPILKVGGVQYWPFSYIDNREGMAIVAFDNNGKQIKRWDKQGARYVWKIEENLDNNQIVFIGQAGRKIIMSWSELTNLHFEVGVSMPTSACPSVPAGLKLTALQSPDTLAPATGYPVLLIGKVQYWPLSYIDNREGMAILAFDDRGKEVKRWDKAGGRYICRIEETLNTGEVAFVGQAGRQVTMKWSELAHL